MRPALKAKNGTVHVIDRFLFPSEDEPTTLPTGAAAGSVSRFASVPVRRRPNGRRRRLHGAWGLLLAARGHFMRTSPIMCPPRVMAAAAAYAALERQPSAAVRQAKLSEMEMEKFRQAHAGVPLYLKYPSCPALPGPP